MTSTAPVKKPPCNRCRERKRKCSYGQPCERCAKAGVECVYTLMQSPKDLEYMQELEYISQIESLQYQIASMEKEMAVLKLANESRNKQQPEIVFYDYPSPVSESKASFPGSKKRRMMPMNDFLPELKYLSRQPPRLIDFTTQEDRNHFIKHINDQACDLAGSVVCFNQDNTVSAKEEPIAWDVSFKDGQFNINTHILSYTHLYRSLSTMPNVDFNRTMHRSRLPVHLQSMQMAQESAIGAVMSVMIWRKYMKARFKSFHSIQNHLNSHPQQVARRQVVSVEGLTTLTVRLLGTYFQCGHYLSFGIYVPTFVKEYVQQGGNVLHSPAAMALCGVICSSFCCRHVLMILPDKEALQAYGAFYVEQAREMIEDEFDTVDMETMMTFGFMALYHIQIHGFQEAEKYTSMAERIFDLLKQQNNEDILLRRFERIVHQCRATLDLHWGVEENMERPRLEPYKIMELLDWSDHVPIVEGPEDTEKERQFIRMRKYIAQLRNVVNDGGKYAFAPDYPTFISVFGHHIEMGMRNWYRTTLPQEFQLSLPLFDDHVDDLQFFATLETECGESPVKLITLSNVYNEYLVMAKSYLPRHPPEVRLETQDLIRKFKELQYTSFMTDDFQKIQENLDAKSGTNDKTYHWLKLVAKMRYLRQYKREHFTEEELEESDEDYFVRFIKALNPSELTFNMPITHTSVKVAFNMVRLSQFWLTKDYACFYDMRWIFNAWDILTRAVRFKYQQPEDHGVTLDRVRANLLLSLQMLKEFVEFSSSTNNNSAFLNQLQEEFDSSFV